MREALFNILGDVGGLKVVDLFAGSGALGFEALSRGAAEVVFVDSASRALAVVKANAASLDLTDSVRLIRRDLGRSWDFLAREAPIDLILADPPYDRGWVARLLTAPLGPLLGGDGLLVVESSPGEVPARPDGWRIIRDKAYGQTHLTILAPEGA